MSRRYSDGAGAIHLAREGRKPNRPLSLCAGITDLATTTERARVTCKRCLRSLARGDREFQRKARRFLLGGDARLRWSLIRRRGSGQFWPGLCEHTAARALAAEEGRS